MRFGGTLAAVVAALVVAFAAVVLAAAGPARAQTVLRFAHADQ